MLLYVYKIHIYNSAGTDSVNGMTFYDTLIYLVLATALFNFMEMHFVWEIGRDIQSGKIILKIIRPMNYQTYIFWSFSGSLVIQFVTTFLPTFIIVKLMTGDVIQLKYNMIFFVISVAFAVVINFCLDSFIGTICLFTESIWGLNIMNQVIVLLFSGATIPLAFFPEALRRIVYFLPYQSIYNAPLTILLNGNSDVTEMLKIIGIQAIWCVVLIVFNKKFWSFSFRRLMVNGG